MSDLSPARLRQDTPAPLRRDAPAPGQPLRILHVMRAPVGGLFRHVLDLAGEQARRGHSIGMIADRNAADALTLKRLADIAPKLRLGLSLVSMRREPGFGDLAALRSVVKISRALDLDVLHGHGAKGGAYARLAKLRLSRQDSRVAAFYTPHGGSLHYKPGTATGTVFQSAERVLARMTDGLIFESDFARQAYARLVGAGGPQRRVIPNGVGPDDFAAPPLDPGGADFLFVGELRTLKGVDILLRALAQIVAKRPARAAIVGAGTEGDSLKALARELGLDAYVTFPGAMPAREAFRLGRVLVVPSRAESFPYVVLEAGAAGKPLIATRVGGIPEIVAGTRTELVAPDAVEPLATAMTAALEDPEAAELRAAELREVVGRKFTVSAMTDAVLDFYRSVSAERPPLISR